jgi:predicted MFS family arabinose efflux permease
MSPTSGEPHWDSPLAVVFCMSACVAAYGVSDSYGFSSRDIGWTGAAENAGMLLGSVLVSMAAKSGRFRLMILTGIAIATAGNAITAFVHSFIPMAGMRLITGFGSGICYSAAIACLSLMRNSARHFSVFIVILVIANSLELWLVPSLLSALGLPGLYAVFALAYLAPVLLLRSIPAIARSCVAAPASGHSHSVVGPQVLRLAWWCLFAIVMFNVAASAFWAYSERIGAQLGMSAQSVANTLTLCNLFSLTGGALAYWLSRHWGQHRPQLVAIAIMMLVFGAWSLRLSVLGYVVGVLVFFEVWAMTMVFQLGTLNGIDASGQYVALVPAAQGLGQSAGPFIAGALLGWNFGFSQVLMAMLVFIAACFGAYLLVYLRLRRHRPELAAA